MLPERKDRLDGGATGFYEGQDDDGRTYLPRFYTEGDVGPPAVLPKRSAARRRFEQEDEERAIKAAKARRDLRRQRPAHEALQEEPLLEYIPLGIFAGLSIVTMGLYPYVWFRRNIRAFVELSLEQVDEPALHRYSALGAAVQLFLYLACLLKMTGALFGAPILEAYALYSGFFYLFLNAAVLIPIKSFLYFNLRWNLRRAVATWDSNIITVPRTMPSWWRLFIFGGLYIQYHVNRVIGLGMPGFADADDMRDSPPFMDWLTGYLHGIGEPVSRGRRR